ncbi:MAG TPA: RidA family protein [Candidatus Saccharibacteria bacterium]|nr:RidA family protein [Candidatus Saccharibacteria bacterium]
MMEQTATNKVASNDSILSQAVEANGFVFVSGQIHADAEWQLVGDTTSERFAVCMQNIRTILEAAGLNLDAVVKLTLYVTDMTQIPEINSEYSAYFDGVCLPARETIGVAALPLGASLEVSVIAVRSQV